MNEKAKLLVDGTKEILNYLRSKYRLYHLSNVFFRDIHYGLLSYLEVKGMKSSYAEAEHLTLMWISACEHSGVFKRVEGGAWMLNYPDFKKPAVKPAAPAKSAAGAAAQKPAWGVTPVRSAAGSSSSANPQTTAAAATVAEAAKS
ncbi:MAG TPA: hypothetical protein DCP63_13325 [Bacteroidetes bacterium]|nr:hypothetical protein [Bacteroidota bacterium]